MRTEFLSELIGTFVMVFIGCYAIKAGYSPAIISCSFGFAVFIVILKYQYQFRASWFSENSKYCILYVCRPENEK